ncbi:MAG: plastocyanin, partial [SAR202 cluster bacterium]|nr:plastocyanin [SAR202 cluster bacterium]
SQGTKVVWTNNEAVPHFVNTDPHPSHNNLPGLNSLDLREGQSYTFTFVQAGEWAYHCSAHYPQGMVGSVLVR